MQRYRFYSQFRQPNKSVSAFVVELRSLAKDCDFGATLEENLRDKLVCGISNPAIQKSLLSQKNLTFKTAFEIAQSYESAAKNMSTLQESGHQIHDVHKLEVAASRVCYRCGQTGHRQEHCKYKSSTCHYCGKIGHIKPVCRSRKQTTRSFESRYSSPRPSDSLSRSSDSSPRPSDSSPRRPHRYRSFRSSQQNRAASEIKQIMEEPTTSTGGDIEPEVAIGSIPFDSNGIQFFVYMTAQ